MKNIILGHHLQSWAARPSPTSGSLGCQTLPRQWEPGLPDPSPPVGAWAARPSPTSGSLGCQTLPHQWEPGLPDPPPSVGAWDERLANVGAWNVTRTCKWGGNGIAYHISPKNSAPLIIRHLERRNTSVYVGKFVSISIDFIPQTGNNFFLKARNF